MLGVRVLWTTRYQGTQHTSWAFTQRAQDSGRLPSMGAVGDVLRQCSDGGALGPCTGRVAGSAGLEHAPGTGESTLRVPENHPHPAAPPLSTRNADADRVRDPPRVKRDRHSVRPAPPRSSATPEPPSNPGQFTTSALAMPTDARQQ